MNFGVYDPTLYTAIDFAKDTDIVVEGKGFAACKHTVVRPDPDQVIAQIELFQNTKRYEKKVYTLPKKLDEEVARLHLEKIGVKLTVLADSQSAYLGVPKEGPYKSDHYRY